MEHVIVAAVGVGLLHGIAAAAHAIGFGVEGGPPGAAFNGGQLQVHANLGEHGLQRLAQLLVEGVLGVVIVQGQPLGAGSSQQILGLFGVVLIGHDVGGVAFLTLYQGHVADNAGALVHKHIQHVAVNGIHQRLTDFLGYHIRVEGGKVEIVAAAAVGAQHAGLLSLQEVGGGRVEVEVSLAIFHGDIGLVVVGHKLDHDGLDVGRAVPVFLIGLQHNLLRGIPLHKLVSAGAHGVAGKLVGGAGSIVIGVDDGAVPQHGEEVAVSILQLHVHGVVVHDFAAVNGERSKLHPGFVAEALDGQLHVLGGEVIAVVELHALAELEGVGQAIPGHGPLGGQAGLDGQILANLHQTVKNVGAEVDLRGRGQRQGIQGGELGAQDDSQAIVGSAGKGCGHGTNDHHQRQHQGNKLFHGHYLLQLLFGHQRNDLGAGAFPHGFQQIIAPCSIMNAAALDNQFKVSYT